MNIFEAFDGDAIVGIELLGFDVDGCGSNFACGADVLDSILGE